MNPSKHPFVWFLTAFLAIVIVLSLMMLILPGALPGAAGWLNQNLAAITNGQSAAILGSQNLLTLYALTNGQSAAILGGQNLLLLNQGNTFLFLPLIER